MINERGSLKPVADISRINENETPELDIKNLFEVRLPAVVGLYTEILKGNSPHLERKEIARYSEEELKRHLSELDLLVKVLKQFGNDPTAFEIRTRGMSEDEMSYRVRLKTPDSGSIGTTSETAQTQFCFFARITHTGETREQLLAAESLKGSSPHQALKRANRQFDGGEIMLNTSGIIKDERSGRFLVIPRAGIELIKEGEYIDLNGLKPVGVQFHKLSIPNEDDIKLEEYLSLHDTITAMNGYRPA